MLLMIELFMGDYKGVGNDSGQEFHSIPETPTKVFFAGCWTGLCQQKFPRAGERSTNPRGCRVILL